MIPKKQVLANEGGWIKWVNIRKVLFVFPTIEEVSFNKF